MRNRAEAAYKAKQVKLPDDLPELSPSMARLLVHDLRVHQIELEMQNEELRRAQEELEAARERYFDLYDLAPVGYCSVGETGLILEANLATSALLRMTRDELVGQRFSRFIFNDDQDAYYLRCQRVRNLGELQLFESRMVKGDTTSFCGQLTISAVKNERGQHVYRIVLSDITRRKEVETALSESREQYHRILQCAMDGFWLVDAEGMLQEANESYCRMSGYSEPELLSMRIKDLEASETADETALHISKVRELGQDRFQSRHRRKDGSVFDVEISVQYQPLKRGTFVVFIQDLTERRKAEAASTQLQAQLRESQKMEALGTLAAGIAHDFNNILAAIIGNTELVHQDVGPGHPALESLDEIGKASRRARGLVQQILAFGRRQATVRESLSLAPIVQEAAKLLRSTIPAGVGLNVVCAPDAPSVLADATQIEQILINLGSNAWHAIEAKERAGLIEIRLEAEVRGALHFAKLTVRDNGQGMDGTTRARIFEPFFTTKAVGKGTGLGLSVVYGIVQAHQADIEVHSAPGEGTVFVIRFPAVQQPVAFVAANAGDVGKASAGEPLALHSEGKRLLYVDDEKSIVSLMTRLLRRRGYRISGYTDPRKALEAVRANPDQFDLAVTDYNMPSMSGLKVARTLHEIRADLPVILISGYITVELARDALAAGVRELIFKADAVDDVCDALARCANAEIGKERSS